MEKIDIGTLPQVAIIFGIAVLMIGAFAITNDQFEDTLGESRCYNGSFFYNKSIDRCVNSTPTISAQGYNNMNFSDKYYSMREADKGTIAFAGQMPTLATILVMAVIIGIITGIYIYFRGR